MPGLPALLVAIPLGKNVRPAKVEPNLRHGAGEDDRLHHLVGIDLTVTEFDKSTQHG